MVWPEAGAREKPGGWRLSGNEWMGGGILSAASLVPRAAVALSAERRGPRWCRRVFGNQNPGASCVQCAWCDCCFKRWSCTELGGKC